jgi:hypothetical protein
MTERLPSSATDGFLPGLQALHRERIERNRGEQLDLETGCNNYRVCVTNDHQADPSILKSEHRHKSSGSRYP